MKVWVLLLGLLLLASCTPTATGRAVRDLADSVKPVCPIGVELRVTEINGLPKTCYNDQRDIMEIAVDGIDRTVVGMLIELVGETDSVNITNIPSERKVVMRYEVPEISETVGKLSTVTVYPIANVDGDVVVCSNHPLKADFEFC